MMMKSSSLSIKWRDFRCIIFLPRVVYDERWHSQFKYNSATRSEYMYHVVDGAAEAQRIIIQNLKFTRTDGCAHLRLKNRTRYMYGVGFDWFRYIGGRHIYEKLVNDNSGVSSNVDVT